MVRRRGGLVRALGFALAGRFFVVAFAEVGGARVGGQGLAVAAVAAGAAFACRRLGLVGGFGFVGRVPVVEVDGGGGGGLFLLLDCLGLLERVGAAGSLLLLLAGLLDVHFVRREARELCVGCGARG